MRRYALNRVLWSARVVLGIAAPAAVLFLLAGIIADKLPFSEVLLIALAALGAGAAAFLVMLCHPWRFVRMIRRQEEALGVSFGEEEFTPTQPRASRLNQHDFHSVGWYMCEGSWALHRLYIVKVTQKSTHYNYGRVYHAHVETADGRACRLRMESASDLKRFCRWYKEGRP